MVHLVFCTLQSHRETKYLFQQWYQEELNHLKRDKLYNREIQSRLVEQLTKNGFDTKFCTLVDVEFVKLLKNNLAFTDRYIGLLKGICEFFENRIQLKNQLLNDEEDIEMTDTNDPPQELTGLDQIWLNMDVDDQDETMQDNIYYISRSGRRAFQSVPKWNQ